MSKPVLSALIDAYNHERYIEQPIVRAIEQNSHPPIIKFSLLMTARPTVRRKSFANSRLEFACCARRTTAKRPVQCSLPSASWRDCVGTTSADCTSGSATPANPEIEILRSTSYSALVLICLNQGLFMSSPAISVVMSVFNGEAFLTESIDSILGQTFTDFEFVIIDDGSNDRTPEILSDFAKRDSRVRVFPQKNEGRAESLNRGIDLVRSPLIARMDADDISLSNRLKEQYEFMDRHPEVGLLGSGVEFVAPGGKRLGFSLPPPVDDAELRNRMRYGNQFYHPTVIMRKEVVVAAGKYRKALCDADDFDLFLRVAELTKLASLPRPILLYRIHSSQTSIRRMSHQALCVLAARTAFVLRSRGVPDPLSGVDEITPELVRKMGPTDEGIFCEAAGEHLHWMALLAKFDTDAALDVIDRLLSLCKSSTSPVGKKAAVNGLLKAASIHFQHGRPVKALTLANRALLRDPMEASRVAKMAFANKVHKIIYWLSRP
jgi:glycosyltransferase involved in cell wall biosynthesis